VGKGGITAAYRLSASELVLIVWSDFGVPLKSFRESSL
jgi:hypothetical protein